jgi:hypothetical protein
MGQALVISGTMMSSPGALSSSFMSSRASHRWEPEKWTQAEQRLVSRNFLSSSLLKRPMGAAIASKGAKICSNVELAARRRGLLMTQSGLRLSAEGTGSRVCKAFCSISCPSERRPGMLRLRLVRAATSCKLVENPIGASGWCQLFVAKRQ